jgi:small-conductance mechanosensitive channel
VYPSADEISVALAKLFRDQEVFRDVVATALLLVGVFGARALAMRFVRDKLPKQDQLQLRLAAQVRGVSYVLLFLGLVVIWAAQLQALALSFVVLAMAIVWATKEIIACLLGAFYRVTSNAFSVGDRIQLAGVRGDVIDQGLLSTLVLEVGVGHQRTGRSISIPNSALLIGPVVNESVAGEYMLHVMTIPVSRDENLGELERRALLAANEACADFIDDVRRSIGSRYRRHGLNPPSVDPRVTYQLVDENKVALLLRIPTPVRLERDVEQRVLRAVFGLPGGRDTLVPPPPEAAAPAKP